MTPEIPFWLAYTLYTGHKAAGFVMTCLALLCLAVSVAVVGVIVQAILQRRDRTPQRLPYLLTDVVPYTLPPMRVQDEARRDWWRNAATWAAVLAVWAAAGIVAAMMIGGRG